MPLNLPDFSTLVRILERSSGWQREEDRRALLDEALWESPRKHDIAGQLDLSGGPHNAAVRAVSRLSQFGQDIAGRDVCCLLIAALNRNVGHDEQADLRAISHRLNCPLQVDNSIKGDHAMLPPELVTMSVPFLFEIGRWAKSELSEIWKLRRKQQEIELSKQETISDKAELKTFIEETASDFGEEYAERVLRQVGKKRELYLGQIERIDTAREQRRMGELTEDMLNAQMEHAEKQKKQLLKEARELLESLGLTKE